MFDGTCLSPAYKTESVHNTREQIIKYDNLSGGVLCVILYELLYRQRRLYTIICMPFIIVCDHRTVVKTRRTSMYIKKNIPQKSKPETGRKLVVTAATGAMSCTIAWLSYCGVV